MHYRTGARILAAGAAMIGLLTATTAMADRQDNERAAIRGEIQQLFKARHDRNAENLHKQQTPAVIPKDSLDANASGVIQTIQPAGPTLTRNNAFFQDLGSNGRTCFTCHQGDQGWSVSAENVQARFHKSGGLDPIFRPVDGAVCPTANTATLAARKRAYSLLLNRGLIRVGLPYPAGAEFSIVSVNDPYDCNTDPQTGLTSQTSGTVSVYRRPLPTTNLRFLSAVMWDGREGGLLPPQIAPVDQPTLLQDLAQQAIDATLGHAQAANPPTAEQVAQMVDFEMGITTAQLVDADAGALNANHATGGAVALSQQSFYVGINDPIGLNPTGTPFTSKVFNLYDAWASQTGGGVAKARAAIARGQAVFNTKPINITGVAGINDALNLPSLAGTCGTCHDAPNAGDHSVKMPLNIGVSDAGRDAPPALDTAALPVFTVRCSVATAFHPANTSFKVTDLGRAMLSGKCADIGKTKGPVLRGLASRAPYFHNGSAARLVDAVNFYDKRFAIGFTKQEKSDLVAFLDTL